jgi:hypothetical protein
MRLVREARQCGTLAVHIVGWGERNALTTGGNLLQDHIAWWTGQQSYVCNVISEQGGNKEPPTLSSQARRPYIE